MWWRFLHSGLSNESLWVCKQSRLICKKIYESKANKQKQIHNNRMYDKIKKISKKGLKIL
jgi:hypothetical protein